MNDTINNTRRQLGELGAMSAKTEAAERRILEQAEKMLAEVEAKIKTARAQAMKSPDDYMHLIEERGRLQQIIAQAHEAMA